MLSCLDARQEVFPKDAFLLRTGDTVGSVGIVLSGETEISSQKQDRDRFMPPPLPVRRAQC